MKAAGKTKDYPRNYPRKGSSNKGRWRIKWQIKWRIKNSCLKLFRKIRELRRHNLLFQLQAKKNDRKPDNNTY
jgi:hypothetical protein